MPFAQHHYPFEHQDDFSQLFPAAFICEGVDQTRGWFYTLHALGVLLRGGPAFENCIVLGHILDDQGRKMSKRLGNIVDPWTVLAAEGADALRYYMYTASPTGSAATVLAGAGAEVAAAVFADAVELLQLLRHLCRGRVRPAR
jgi:isoleucyl-tRNA synthetase